jgi:hypothetical protein
MTVTQRNSEHMETLHFTENNMETPKKAPCPFCKENKFSIRGEGCCNCEHTGLVPYGEAFIFRNEAEAINHDPGTSYFDLHYERTGKFNYKNSYEN